MKHNGNISVVENRVEPEGEPAQPPPPLPLPPPLPPPAAPKQPGSDVTISVVNKQGNSGTYAGLSGRPSEIW